jgi:hypothetical protein
VRLDEHVEIFFSVIVGDFITSLDPLRRVDEDSVFRKTHFGVGTAGVVHVTRNIFSRSSENRKSIFEIKEISTADVVRLFAFHELPPIFDHEATRRNIFIREDAETRRAPADTKRVDWRTRGWIRHIGRQCTR